MPSKKTGNVVRKITYSKGKVTIRFDLSSFTLSENAFTEFVLYEGKEINDKEMGRLEEESRLDPYINYAMGLLASKPYTEKQIAEKLYRKGAYKTQIAKVISRLKKQGLIDDKEYASEYLEASAENKLLGKNRIIAELKNRGISEDELSSLSFSYEKELEKARSYAKTLDKKLANTPNGRKNEKAVYLLMNHGFDRSIALEAIKELTPTESNVEIRQLQMDYNKAKERYSKKYQGYELRQKVVGYLLSKGYRYDDISNLQEEEDYENDQ